MQRSSHWASVTSVFLLVYLAGLLSVHAHQTTPTSEREALLATRRINDPAAELAALNKIRADPSHSDLFLDRVDFEIFRVLVHRFPERTSEINKYIDRLRSRPLGDRRLKDRFNALLDPATELIANRVLLDRAEFLLTDAAQLASFEAVANDERMGAQRAKQPAPTDDSLRSRFAISYRIPLGEQQGLLRVAKGDLEGAERVFKDTMALRDPNDIVFTLSDDFGDLADALYARGDKDHAEQLLKEVQEANPDVQQLYLVRAKFYAGHDHIQQAKDLIKPRLNAQQPSNFPQGELLLAEMDSRTGDYDAALSRYMKLAASGWVKGADYETMARAYRQVHGSDAGLEAEIDRVYREQFPNPVKPEKWTPLQDRAPRLVVAQLFTGSGCGPCVAADLAVEAMMQRYPADAVVPLFIHAHVPNPDPMTTSGGAALADLVADGVPTLLIDGDLAKDDKGEQIAINGPRPRARVRYSAIVDIVDNALSIPPTAEVSVRGKASGDQVDVDATVSKLPPSAKDLRLVLVLAERELRYTGENGVRFHPMVVRATTGAKADGQPLAGTGTQHYAFRLAAIRDDITKSLDNVITHRKLMLPLNAPPAVFAAEGHAMTKVDVNQLIIVAIVQDAKRHVLQAARADVGK